MNIIKTYYGFKIKKLWLADVNVYKLFSKNEEYDITFAGELLAKITINRENPMNNKIKIIYSRNMNIPEKDIADIGIKVIEAALSLN